MTDFTMTSRSSSSICAWSAASACCRVVMPRSSGPGTRLSRARAVKESVHVARDRRSSPLVEGAFLVELHQGLRSGAEGGPAAGHRGGLHGLEQLTLRRPVLDGPAHVRDHAVLAAAEGQDADDDHLAVLDGQLLALSDPQLAQRLPRPDVLRVFAGDPLPERIPVGADGLRAGLRGASRRTTSAHRYPPRVKCRSVECRVGHGRDTMPRGPRDLGALVYHLLGHSVAPPAAARIAHHGGTTRWHSGRWCPAG